MRLNLRSVFGWCSLLRYARRSRSGTHRIMGSAASYQSPERLAVRTKRQLLTNTRFSSSSNASNGSTRARSGPPPRGCGNHPIATEDLEGTQRWNDEAAECDPGAGVARELAQQIHARGRWGEDLACPVRDDGEGCRVGKLVASGPCVSRRDPAAARLLKVRLGLDEDSTSLRGRTGRAEMHLAKSSPSISLPVTCAGSARRSSRLARRTELISPTCVLI